MWEGKEEDTGAVLRTGGLVSTSRICDNKTWHHNQKPRNLTSYVVFTEQFCFMGEALEVAFHTPPVGRHLWEMTHSLEEVCGFFRTSLRYHILTSQVSSPLPPTPTYWERYPSWDTTLLLTAKALVATSTRELSKAGVFPYWFCPVLF